MIQKYLLTLVIVGAAMFGAGGTGSAWAQEGANDQSLPPLNVRVVNIDGIRAQSTAFKAAREQISAFGNTSNQALQQEDKALRDANAELNRKRTLLSPEAFAEERNKFEQSVAAFQRKMQEQQQALNKLQLEVIGQINEKILKIISQYAEENNVTLILPAQSVLLRADAMVMDAYVIERLNKELPSVTVSLPAK